MEFCEVLHLAAFKKMGAKRGAGGRNRAVGREKREGRGENDVQGQAARDPSHVIFER